MRGGICLSCAADKPFTFNAGPGVLCFFPKAMGFFGQALIEWDSLF
jgi:hypothetical protein